jgi:hypothetical protein
MDSPFRCGRLPASTEGQRQASMRTVHTEGVVKKAGYTSQLQPMRSCSQRPGSMTRPSQGNEPDHWDQYR